VTLHARPADAAGAAVARLAGGLVVSCQPSSDGLLAGPDLMARLALAALRAGAAGIRADGPQDVAAVRAAVGAEVPVIGLWKAGDGDVYITPSLDHALAVAEAGADIVAVDGTGRPRPDGRGLPELVAALHARERAVLADVATLAEGRAALAAGADLVATTLSGYTRASASRAPGPDLELVAALALEPGARVIAEGRVQTPEQARRALARGAYAVAVGAAITQPEAIARRFVAALDGA
jgi:putative N-acetylmannosamine-6-phosphate epimerase